MTRIIKLLLISFIIFTVSCKKDEIQPIKENKPELSSEQTLLKSNLDKAAKIIVQIINNKDVNYELKNSFISKNDINSISFKNLIENNGKGSKINLPTLSKQIRDKISSSKDGEDLIKYLINNGCKIYIPYPLDWYSSEKNITIVGHPIDNDIQGMGYIIGDSKLINEVTVDEQYADANPVAIIMPEDPTDPTDPGNDPTTPTTTDPVFGTFGSGSNSIHTVYIGYVWLDDYCGGLFEGDIELRIKRIEPYFNTNTNSVEASDPVHLHINYPRDYAKAAYNGWTQYKNGGWKKVNATWDTNWNEEKDRQGILAYDHDWDASVKKVTIGVTYKGIGLNVSLERDIKYEGDFLGKNDQWWRNWFYVTQQTPTPYDEVKYDCTVRSLGSLKFTTPTYTLYY